MAINTFLQWQAETNYIDGQIANAERLLKPVKAVKTDMAELNSYLRALLNEDTGAWNTSFNYSADIIIRNNNKYYQSLQDNNYGRNPNSELTWWKLLTYADLPSGSAMNINPIDLHASVTTDGLVWFDPAAQQYKKVSTELNDKIVGWLDFTNNIIYTSGAIRIPSGNFWLGDYAVLESGIEGLICSSTYLSATNRKIGYILDTDIIYLDFTNHALDYTNYVAESDLKTINSNNLIGSGNILVGTLRPGDLKTVNGISLVGAGNIQIDQDGGAYRVDVRWRGATWSSGTALAWAKAAIAEQSGDVISVLWTQFYTHGTGNGGSATSIRSTYSRYVIRNASWITF